MAFVKDLLKIAEQLESQKDKDVINLAKMEMSRNEEQPTQSKVKLQNVTLYFIYT